MKEKQVAAAMSAVMAYIKTEEEMAWMQASGQMQPEEPDAAPVRINLWGLNGRQSMMNMRTMMQMKSFHGSKLR